MLQLGLRKCPPGGFCDVRGPKLHPQSLLNACRDLELVMPAQGNHHAFSNHLSPRSACLLLYSLSFNCSQPIAFGEADRRPLSSPCLTTLQIYPLFAANFSMSGLGQNETSSANSSFQFSSSVVSNSLLPHALQHARPPCPSPTPGVYSNSCPLSG